MSLQLLLYRASCNSDGLGEGIFNWEPENEILRKTYLEAMNTVHKYLGYKGNYFIQYSIDGLLLKEDESREFIEYAEKNIKGAEGRILLSHCNHGKIIFDRKIVFNDWESKMEELIEKLKGSGFQKKRKLSGDTWKYHLQPRGLFY